MYVTAILSTLGAWFLGLLIDANIDFGEPQGFLCLRVLFPVLAMGICILKSIKDNAAIRNSRSNTDETEVR